MKVELMPTPLGEGNERTKRFSVKIQYLFSYEIMHSNRQIWYSFETVFFHIRTNGNDKEEMEIRF